MPAPRRLRALMLLLFFLSGVSGLVYQIVWTRLLVLVFGNTMLATSTVVASFMGGLAAGSYVLGRYIDARPRPLIRLYAILETGIGVFALAFPFLLDVATPVYGFLYRSLEGNIALLNLVRFGVCFGLILVPTFLMGGTLPVLLKRFATGAGSLGYQLGFLYGLNTAGAVIGCLAAGYLLLRTLGMQGTTLVAVAINLGVAAVSWLLARREAAVSEASSPEEDDHAPVEAEPLHGESSVRWVLIGAGISGFCALAYELLWTRMLNLFLNNNVYSFTATLATFLFGIAFGSLLYSSLLSRIRRQVQFFALLQIAIGLCAYATPFLFSVLQGPLFSRQGDAVTLAKTAVIMIFPTVLMGIALPLAVQICQRGPRKEGTTVGTVYAINTMGSILGAFAAGFVIVPLAGLHAGLIAVVVLNLLGGLLAMLPVALPPRRPVWVGGVAILAGALVFSAPAHLFRDIYDESQTSTDILHYEEGRIANVVVYDFFKSGYKDLFLNAIEEASSRIWHVQLFKMLGILPTMVHDDPDEALMIAFGAGMSAGAAIQHVDRLTVVDLNPDVEGVGRVFAHENRNVLDNPRLTRVVNDGRNALLLDERRYPVIISDATNPKTFDSWTLYTREFYELVASRLEPGGVFCQWLVIPLPYDSIKILLNTFRSVFPHTSLWCIYGSSQCFLLGTPERLEIDYQDLERRLEPIWESSGLAEYGIRSTEKFLSYLLLGEDELNAALAGFTTINTDDLPRVQFQVGEAIEGTRALLDLLEHQSSVEPYLAGDVSDETRRKLEAYRSISRRLQLGFLLNNRGEAEEARAVAERAGLHPDQNVRSGLRFDSERKRYFVDRLEHLPDDHNARNTLGYIYWMEGAHEDAIRELREALRLRPDFSNARANLARAYADAGSYDAAEREWMEVRRRNPARRVLSMVRRESSLLHLRRKLHYEPDSPSLLLALADAKARAGDRLAEAEAVGAAATLLPEDPAIQLRLAGAYENLEFAEEALGAYEALARLVPGDARFARKARELAAVVADWKVRQLWLNSNEIVLSSPGQRDDGHPASCRAASEVWNDFAFDGSVDPENVARAAALYEEAIAQQPDHAHAYADAAGAYEALGRYAAAATLWQRGLELAPGNAVATSNARRLALLLQVAEAGKDSAAADLVELAGLERQRGDLLRAIELLERVAASAPNRGGLSAELAAAYADAGKYPDAIEALEQSLARRPSDPEALKSRLARLQGLVTGSTPRPEGNGGAVE